MNKERTVSVPCPDDGEALVVVHDPALDANVFVCVPRTVLPWEVQEALLEALGQLAKTGRPRSYEEAIADAVAEATANPGHVVEVKPS